jgi:hypothetical protein
MSGFQMVTAAILFLANQKPGRIFPAKLDCFKSKMVYPNGTFEWFEISMPGTS